MSGSVLQSFVARFNANKKLTFFFIILVTIVIFLREIDLTNKRNSMLEIVNSSLFSEPDASLSSQKAEVHLVHEVIVRQIPGVNSSDLSATNRSCEYKSVPAKGDSPGPRILCAVYTYKAGHRTKLLEVVKTWGKRCDRTIYMSGARENNKSVDEDDSFFQELGIEVVRLNMPVDNKQYLTEKTIQTLVYTYKNLIDTFDWFLKADDDTYVMVNNMRTFLKNKCPDEPFTYGRHFKKYNPHGYLSGGSGYLISRESVRKFGVAMERNPQFCVNKKQNEDVDIAECLQRLDIRPGDSRDELGRERFHPEPLEQVWNTKVPWLVNYSQYEVKNGQECCSRTSIGFHRISNFFYFEYLLYNVIR